MLGSKHTIIFNNKKGKYIKQKRNRQNVKEYNWILNQDDDDENFFVHVELCMRVMWLVPLQSVVQPSINYCLQWKEMVGG